MRARILRHSAVTILSPNPVVPPQQICILTGAHLCHNPRVLKEAEALARAGYEVTVLGAYLNPALKRRDLSLQATAPFQFVPVVDLTLQSTPRTISAARLGKLLYRTTKIGNAWQLGDAYRALKQAAMSTEAQLYICHMEQALAVGVALLRAGKRVAVDMEDWYSEDLPKEDRVTRPIQLLRGLERNLLTSGAFAFCTSQAMANCLEEAYACKPPTPIYNVFPWADRTSLSLTRWDRRDLTRPSIHWFSQTLGRGRGLEELMAALSHVAYPAEVHLRGRSWVGFKEHLVSKIPSGWHDRVFFHDPVHNTELLSRIAEHDIGFAGEIPNSVSRNLTIANKLFHYMLGGLAIVASDTTGHNEIALQAAGAISSYESQNPLSLAKQLNALLSSPTRLAASKTASLALAQRRYCWEVEQAKLVKLVEQSFSPYHAAA